MWQGLLLLLIANFIGGALNPLFVKFGISQFPPITFTALRFLIATAVFYPVYAKKKIKLTKADRKQLFFFSMFFALNGGLYAVGLQYTTILVSQVLYTAVPVLVAVISYFSLKEKFTPYKIIGLIIAFTGIIFMIYESAQKDKAVSFGSVQGNIIILGAIISWSIYLIFSKKLTQKFPPTTTSFYSFFGAAVLFLAISPLEMIFHPLVLGKIDSAGLASLLGVGIISSALMFSLVQFGIQKTSPFTASLLQYLGPVFSALTAVPFAHEKISINLVFGGLSIVTGVFIATTYPYIKSMLQYSHGKRKKV